MGFLGMLKNDLISIYNLRFAILAHSLQSVRARYARSAIGEFWLLFTNLIFVVSIAFVWAIIWSEPVGDFFVYIAVGYILYTLFTSIISDSINSIISDHRIYVNSKVDPIFSISSVYFKSIVIFLHSFPIVVGAPLFLANLDFFKLAYTLLGLLLVLISFLYWAYSIALLCVRYRDLIQIVSLIMQISFLVTPVMWKLDKIDSKYIYIALMNPFSSALNITRDLFLSMPVYSLSYVYIVIWFLIGYVFFLIVCSRLKREFTLWL